jgi:hypothetical protein
MISEMLSIKKSLGPDMVNMMMSQYMLAALMDFDKTYTLKAFPGKQFSGYEFLAYYYMSWAIAEPEHLLDTGLPFHKAYALARQMWKNRQK